MLSACYAGAQEFKTFEPFDLATSSSIGVGQSDTFAYNEFFNQVFMPSQANYDFLSPKSNGYHLSKQSEGIFGDELVVGMKFADWLTVRLNVIDDNQGNEQFSALNGFPQNDAELDGYQLGLSSVLNISSNWRLGFDLGHGRVDGELLGLYQDQLETTSLGVGIRNNRFGATLQGDFMNRSSNNEFEQATMDLQVNWYFTKDGTISFGARKHVNENASNATSLDQLTGTVPYVKFKHNL